MSFHCALIITGPTGVGKTDLVLALGQILPLEIINIDMGQFYEPLSIGTAKPLWRQEPIPHHLFDIVTDPVDISVAHYRKLFQNKIHEIWQRGALPVAVGGSGFYIQSLFFPPKEFSNKLHSDRSSQSTEELWNELFHIDPERAWQINKNDRYRIERALDLWLVTGKQPSLLRPQFDPVCPALIVCLTRERAELCERINARTHVMLKSGWIDEVRRLSPEWQTFLLEKKLIGYPELIEYVRTGHPSLDEVIETIQKKTRAYAKRQMTYWRRFKKLINEHQPRFRAEELLLTFSSHEVYIRQLASLVQTYMESNE